MAETAVRVVVVALVVNKEPNPNHIAKTNQVDAGQMGQMVNLAVKVIRAPLVSKAI